VNDEQQENRMNTTIEAAVPATEHRTTEPTPFPVDDAELASVFAQAKADALAAERLATEAEQRAAAAAEAFRANPSHDTHGAAAVEQQLAHNARERARQHLERAAVLGAEHAQRQKVVRLQELEPAAARDPILRAALEEACALGRDLHARMAQASQRLAALIVTQSAAASEAGRLSYQLGQIRNDLQPLDLAQVNESLYKRVEAAFQPRHLGSGRHGPTPFTVDFADNGDGSVLVRIQAATYVGPDEHGQ